MRITGGSHRGRLLQSPKTFDIRPTSDKVRLAVFNMLEARGAIEGAVVLDAFCGTGALGLESLSRGAAKAIFMDNNKSSLNLVQKNAKALGLEDHAQFIFKDVTKPESKGTVPACADVVFLDPPYRQGFVRPALMALLHNGWVAQKAIIVAECELELDVQEFLPAGYAVLAIKDYGDTRIVLVQNQHD